MDIPNAAITQLPSSHGDLRPIFGMIVHPNEWSTLVDGEVVSGQNVPQFQNFPPKTSNLVVWRVHIMIGKTASGREGGCRCAQRFLNWESWTFFVDLLGSFTRLFSVDISKVAERDFSKIAVRPLKSSQLKRHAGKRKKGRKGCKW